MSKQIIRGGKASLEYFVSKHEWNNIKEEGEDKKDEENILYKIRW